MITVGFLTEAALREARDLYGNRVVFSPSQDGDNVAGWLTMDYPTYISVLQAFSGRIL